MASTPEQDHQLLQGIRKDDSLAFRKLYDSYYLYLVVTSNNILGDSERARDLSQDVLAELWNKRKSLDIKTSLKAYLRRAVINKTLNVIKARRLDFNQPEQSLQHVDSQADALQYLERDDLQLLINTTIENLPERCRVVFTLCRLEKMSHKEIAKQLNISTKTVENQITKAVKTLRRALEPYFNQLMLLCLQFGLWNISF